MKEIKKYTEDGDLGFIEQIDHNMNFEQLCSIANPTIAKNTFDEKQCMDGQDNQKKRGFD